jgi:serine/threonine-protein kinase
MPILGASTEDGPTAYVAPEQLQNGRGGPASDLYAAGILFYTLVTGAPPYAGDDPARLAERLAQEPPELPDHIPDHVTPMFSRMLSPDPDRRPTADRVVSVLGLIETTA